jgi:uncharacterized membrane-anchored protein
MTLNLGYAVTAQVGARTYHRFLYWTVIVATTAVDTTVSDYLTRTAGLGYCRQR